jgi:hypothetical protein
MSVHPVNVHYLIINTTNGKTEKFPITEQISRIKLYKISLELMHKEQECGANNSNIEHPKV